MLEINPVFEDEVKITKNRKGNHKSYKFRNVHISERELQVLSLLTEAYSCPEIARLLGVGVRTVETYKNRLFIKFGVNTILELVVLCYRGYVREN